MARHSRRPMSTMFNQAVGAQKEEEIAHLKAEIERLQTTTTTTHRDPGFTRLNVSQIVALRLPENLKQPRRYFDPVKIAKLRDSIQKHNGVLEPILVRPTADGLYETISGERRWRCCVDLNIETIPAMITEMDDETALEVALIAHLLSEDISAVEETDSIMGLLMLRLQMPFEAVKQFLIAVKNYQTRGDRSEIAEDNIEKVGIAEAILEEFDLKVGSFVSNRLPLLNLATVILEAVRSGQISPTSATLINRAPVDLHEHLLKLGKDMTKAELQETIAKIKVERGLHTTAKGSRSRDNSGIINLFPTYDHINSQLKLIRKKKKLLADQRVQICLNKMDKTIQEIEAIAQEKGIKL
ncbi:MAG: ParB/RepB/Spo0J family partition protein [Leptolyngbya sp. SIO1E4]|nr:ParB/RepB/Spo0J family partition protein [Leptolyngbya sp. SIO1E4]